MYGKVKIGNKIKTAEIYFSKTNKPMFYMTLSLKEKIMNFKLIRKDLKFWKAFFNYIELINDKLVLIK